VRPFFEHRILNFVILILEWRPRARVLSTNIRKDSESKYQRSSWFNFLKIKCSPESGRAKRKRGWMQQKKKRMEPEVQMITVFLADSRSLVLSHWAHKVIHHISMQSAHNRSNRSKFKWIASVPLLTGCLLDFLIPRVELVLKFLRHFLEHVLREDT